MYLGVLHERPANDCLDLAAYQQHLIELEHLAELHVLQLVCDDHIVLRPKQKQASPASREMRHMQQLESTSVSTRRDRKMHSARNSRRTLVTLYCRPENSTTANLSFSSVSSGLSVRG